MTTDTTLDGLARAVEDELRPRADRLREQGADVHTGIETPTDEVRAILLETSGDASPELEVVVEIARAAPDWAVSAQASTPDGAVLDEIPARLVEAPDDVVETAGRFADEVLPETTARG